MSKLSMRARKLDYSKKLRVYRLEEIPDIEDQGQYGRSIIQVATGVEKEEEEEHHLQAFISAAQVEGPRTEPLYIPIPDAQTEISNYDQYYKSNFHRQNKLIRFTSALADELQVYEQYDLDEIDFEWITKHNQEHPQIPITEDQFETIVTQLEALCADAKDGSLPEVQDLPPQSASIPHAADIYNFWRDRRLKFKKSLILTTRAETKPNDPDPYVCFRRRELRQTRKTRRNDQQSYEKLQKLRSEMERVKALLEMMRKRDRLKQESLLLEMLAFEQKIKVRELIKKYQPYALLEDTPDKRISPATPKIRLSVGVPSKGHDGVAGQHSEEAPEPSRITSEKQLLSGIDPAMALYLQYADAPPVVDSKHPEDDFVDLTSVVNFHAAFPEHPRSKFTAFHDIPTRSGSSMRFSRMRVGRGGRIIVDRSPRALDPALREISKFDWLDPEDEFEEHDSRSTVAVPVPFYTPQELNLLNGSLDVARLRLQRMHMQSKSSQGPRSLGGLGGPPAPVPPGVITGPTSLPTPATAQAPPAKKIKVVNKAEEEVWANDVKSGKGDKKTSPHKATGKAGSAAAVKAQPATGKGVRPAATAR